MSNACPTQDQLLALLERVPTAPNSSALEKHVSSCTKCEQVLADLVSQESSDWNQIKRLLATDEVDDTDPQTSLDYNVTQLMQRLSHLGFENIRELGRGGMGVVFAADQPTMERTVAIKILLGGCLAGPQRTQRLLNEARAIGQLSHPNVLKIFDTIEVDGIPGLVLEFARGGSLAGKLLNGPMQANEAADCARQIAEGLSHAHENNLLHRDVKPANILFTSSASDSLEVKLADFGLAKDFDRSQELTGSLIVGTPTYMSPEQIRGEAEAIGPPTDVYAVGVVLYEMLVGAPPFRGATPAAAHRLITTQEPVGPRHMQPAIPKDLETICLKCLEKDARHRYASAEQLRDDLVRYQSGYPIIARPATATQRMAKWCRRNPAQAALFATASVAVIAIATTWAVFTSRLSGVNSELAEKNTTLNRTNDELNEANALLKSTVDQLTTQQALTVRQLNATKALRVFLLQDLLANASPGHRVTQAIEEGSDVTSSTEEPTIRSLVLKAAESLRGDGLEERFPDQPEVQAEVLTALATILDEFGELELAFEFGQRAVQVDPESAANLDLQHFENLLSFSVQCISMGKFEEAIEICTHILANTEDREPTTLRYAAMHNIAGSHMMLDEPERAVDYSESSLDGYRELLGEKSANALQVAATHAQVLEDLGRYNEAAMLLTATIEGMMETLTEKHPRTISAIGKLASVLQSAKEYDRAIRLFRKELHLYETYVAPDHPKTLYAKADLGNALAVSGEVDEGVSLMQEAMRELLPKVGEDHYYVKKLKNEIAKYEDDLPE